jgi:hypothetical protein
MGPHLASTSSSDPGDDLHRRLRYQGAYGLILLVGMIQPKNSASSVYFELHDDLLIERRDGYFDAVQVKTKEDRSPAKATEEVIVTTIARFIKLDKNFPGQVGNFKIVSSSGFYHSTGASTDLSEVLRVAKTLSPDDLLSTTITKKLCNKLIPPADPSSVSSVLTRIDLIPDPPGLDNAEDKLFRLIADLDICAEALSYQLRLIKDRLMEAAYRASSYRPEGVNYDAIAVLNGPQSVELANIKEKRLTTGRVCEIVQECLLAPPPANFDFRSLTERDNRLLRMKMTIGGVPARSIDAMSSAVHYARYQLQVRKKRYSREEANSRELQLRAIVHCEFDDIFEGLSNVSMLSGRDLYRRFRSRISSLPKLRNDICDANSEELLGIAGILTEDCSLWWTEERCLPEAL